MKGLAGNVRSLLHQLDLGGSFDGPQFPQELRAPAISMQRIACLQLPDIPVLPRKQRPAATVMFVGVEIDTIGHVYPLPQRARDRILPDDGLNTRDLPRLIRPQPLTVPF